MELAYASLHQLCGPLLDRLEQLPAPQRDALRIVFGLSAGPVPDRFFVGLAVLSLLSEAADERPLLCVVDDAQWLDHASALTLAFVARRLLADPVGLVFAAREPVDALQYLPEFAVHGLRSGDARALFGSAVRFRFDERVRDRILAETRGNPLALLELPRGLTVTQLAGGFGLLGAQGLSGRIEESFIRRLEALPDDARRLLLVAAAEPVGDPLLLWRAADRLGIAPAAAEGRKRKTCWRSASACGSVIRSRVPPSTDRRRHRNAGRFTSRWRRRPTGTSIRTAVRGTWPLRRRDPTRRSPQCFSVLLGGRRRVADSLPRRRSCNAPSR
jgi:hypothetical protein